MIYSLFLDFSFMLTPNICEFVGPLGMELIVENVYWIATCFKQNKEVIDSFLDVLRKVCDYNFNSMALNLKQ